MEGWALIVFLYVNWVSYDEDWVIIYAIFLFTGWLMSYFSVGLVLEIVRGLYKNSEASMAIKIR